MLVTLRVKNLALVENIRVDFQPGLNVITGETGAGKSILLGALSLLLGERADKKYIRSGEDACGAEALFSLANPRVVDALLAEFGLPACEDRQLIIRRVVKASGSSQNLVNDAPVTLQVLKKLGELLIDMHGPHDHQSLLSPDFQLQILDAYGHLDEPLAAYRAVYARMQDITSRLAELQGDESDVAAQIDLLKYKIAEIEDAAPVEGEEEKITAEHRLSSNAQRILDLGGGLAGALVDDETSVFEVLASVQRRLEELARLMPEAESWRSEARSAAVQLKELGETIRGAMDHVEADPARLAWLEQRVGAYQKLKRKYGGATAEVLAILQESKARLRDLETRGEQAAKLTAEKTRTEADLLQAGRSLTKARAAVAAALAKAITKELRALGFAHGGFHVDLRTVAPKATGLDDVEFGFAPNVGEAMKPLRDIASSGEISRVMLAVKAVLADHDRIPVLIFDEIDANIGGETGNAVGKKLAQLGRSHQVICITHLPQVAIHGAHQFAVRKHVREGRTLTEVQALDQDGRVEEVARMLGGRDLTKVTLQHAREMLGRAS